MKSSTGSILGLGLLLASGTLLPAEVHDGNGKRLSITLRIYDFVGVSERVLESAHMTVSQVFRHAGVSTNWIECPVSGEAGTMHPGCRTSLGRLDFVIRVQTKVPERFIRQAGVSGFAIVPANGGYGRHVSVLYPRIEKTSLERLVGATTGLFANSLPTTRCTGLILGTVMAHEIGHLLLGANSHSRQGIMKWRWSRQDLEDSFLGRQTFTPKQIKQIRADIQARRKADGRSPALMARRATGADQ